MSDAWTNRKQRCLINLLVNSLARLMFVNSIDGSNFVKTDEKLFEPLDSLVEEIKEEKDVQVITDNKSNYVLVGKYWNMKDHIFIELLLQPIAWI